jgi:hypothetical protein
VVDSFEHGNDPAGAIKGTEFFLLAGQLLVSEGTRDSAPLG